MTGRLKEQRALITGAARGIGEAIAREFVAEGARVVIADIREEEGAKLADELGPSAVFQQLDVTNPESWAQMVASTEPDPVDVLINNAGAVIDFGPLHETSHATWQKIIDLNLTGTFLGLQAIIPTMVAQGHGSIVNLSSISGVVGHDVAAAYQSAKGGIRVLTKNAAITYASSGLRVNSIHPGIIATPMVADQPDWATQAFVAATPMGHPGRPEDVAYAAIYLASPESAFVTGAELYVDGGFVAQ
jgi:3alpha(or 20beta)-hydroxysteroid dehydrogenase